MIGFETIGNAMLIAYDDQPILTTDPWLNGNAYFGSWGLSHAIPPEQIENIKRCPYHWLSHAHPDHLNMDSLAELSHAEFLLAHHVGQRMERDLKEMGFRVRILPEREWVQLSPHLRVMTLANHNQDSVLLLDLNGRLVLNLNDTGDLRWGRFIRAVAQQYRESYLLNLVGWSDANMMNFYNEEGQKIPHPGAIKSPIGWRLQDFAIKYRARKIIPFSSFHQFQREDSMWGNEFVPAIQDYYAGSMPHKPEVLPPFLRVDCERDDIEELTPPANPLVVRSPAEFGDHWADPLTREEEEQLVRYIQAKEKLKDHLGFVRFRVGGKETTIDLDRRKFARGITFEVPRQSLMTAVQYEVFDDLLIGNFMKTTLHGLPSLYPYFCPIVPKYADNGRAQSKAELRQYLWQYIRRDVTGHLMTTFENRAVRLFQTSIPENSGVYRVTKKLYWSAKSSYKK